MYPGLTKKLLLLLILFLLFTVIQLGATNSYYYFWLAEQAMQQHAYPQADSLLQIAHRLDPRSQEVIIKRLEVLYYQAKYDDIIEVAHRAFQNNFNSSEIYIMLADALVKKDKPDKAKAYLKHGIEKTDEGKERIYFELAKINYQQEEIEKLNYNLDKARELAREDIDFLYKIARLYAKIGEQPQYINLLQNILNLDPDYYQANIWLGDYYFSQKEYEKVIQYLYPTLKESAQPPRSSLKQLIIAFYLEESYEKALEIAEQVSDFYFDLRIYKLLFLASFRTRQFELTIDYGKKILSELPSEKREVKDQTLEMLGIAYFNTANLTKAFDCFQEINNQEALISNKQLLYSLSLELKRSSLIKQLLNYAESKNDTLLACTSRVNYAYLLVHTDSLQKSREMFNKIDLENCTNDHVKTTYSIVALHLNMDLDFIEEVLISREKPFRSHNIFIGNWFVEQGKTRKAIPYFQKARENEPESKFAFTLLADAYKKLDNVEKEIEILQAAVAKYPQDAQMLNWLGYTYAENETNLDEAIKILQKAVKLDSGNVYIWDSLAWAYYQKSNYNKALKSMQPVLKSKAQDSVVSYHLGNIFWKLGQKEKAIKHWKAAKQVANNEEATKEAQLMLEKIEAID